MVTHIARWRGLRGRAATADHSNLATVKSHLACLRLLQQAEQPGPLDAVERDMSSSITGHGLLTLGMARIF